MSERRIRSLKRTLNDLLIVDAELTDETPELTTSPEGMDAFVKHYVGNPVSVKDFKAKATRFSTPFPKRAQRHMVEQYIVELRIREIRYELMNLSRRSLRRVR
jgi:alcohol dehydrogenase class IV